MGKYKLKRQNRSDLTDDKIIAKNQVEPKESSDEFDDDDISENSGSTPPKNIKQKSRGPNSDLEHKLGKPKAVITFMGRNITSKVGVWLFKFMSIVVPLLPTFALVLYNGIQLESLITRSNLLQKSFEQVQNAISLSVLTSCLQNERYSLVFQSLSTSKGERLNQSIGHDEYIARTDLAISHLEPWRAEIPIKFFASRIRFQIRIDDLRASVKIGKAKIDDILGFYNEATDALLNQYGTEVSSIKGSSTWKSIIVYINLLRAIDNIGVNAAWVIKFYLKGKLSNDEMIQYLRSQVSSLEYLNQASNFSPDVRTKLQAIRATMNYKNLYAIWAEVEDEKTKVNTEDETAVFGSAKKLYTASLQYLDQMREIEAQQVEILRIEAQNENDSSRWFLYQSIILIVTVMTCVAPLIVFLTVKSTILGERFIKALAISGSKVTREQKRSEKLILALLPPTVAARLIEQKKVSFSYDAATIMFCSLYGFSELINTMEPLKSFKLLNEISLELDMIISNFDVYKVEYINNKYMVASGIPKENGNQHASEIARMSIAFIKKIRNLREESSKFPNIYPQIGIHSGNAVGGVIGSKMPRFCLFGETINLASRMESHGEPGRIQISTNTKTLLELTESEGYTIKSRGTISIKGKGMVETYWLIDRKQITDHLEFNPHY